MDLKLNLEEHLLVTKVSLNLVLILLEMEFGLLKILGGLYRTTQVALLQIVHQGPINHSQKFIQLLQIYCIPVRGNEFSPRSTAGTKNRRRGV